MAVSIYSDTRRISRERPTRPTFPGAPAIHLRCMSPDSARTLAHVEILRRETRLNRTDVCTSCYLPPPSLLLPYFLSSPFRTHRSAKAPLYPTVCAPAILRLLTPSPYRWHAEIQLPTTPHVAKWISLLFLLKLAANARWPHPLLLPVTCDRWQLRAIEIHRETKGQRNDTRRHVGRGKSPNIGPFNLIIFQPYRALDRVLKSWNHQSRTCTMCPVLPAHVCDFRKLSRRSRFTTRRFFRRV